MDSDFSPALLGKATSADSAGSVLGSGNITGASGTRFKAGTRAELPGPDVAGVGFMYYASDQVAFYVSDGNAWHRLGPAACGDIVWTNELTARPGYVLLDGSAIANSGPTVDLHALWGGTLPDVQARTFAAVGTHADMNALLKSEGVATVANRRQKHQTTKNLTITPDPHNHGIEQVGGAGIVNGVQNAGATGVDGVAVQAVSLSIAGSVGTGVGTDPVDSGAYIVLQPQAKL